MSSKTQTIDSWLTTHAIHQPDHIALSFEGKDWTYRAVSDWVTQIAAYLSRDHGLRRGDRIAYYGKNSDTEVALLFASARLGLIFVPLNWRLGPAELAYIVADCAPKLLIHSSEFETQGPKISKKTQAKAIRAHDIPAPKTNSAPEAPDISAELTDPLLIVYTSGTTGRPKGAVITQEAVFWNAVISVHTHDFTPGDHTLNLLPLFHVGGINIQMMPTFFVGGRVTLHPAFDPDTALKALSMSGITSTVCVPTVMKALLSHPNWQTTQFRALRLINTGSTDVPVEILHAVNARGIPMVQVYGTTETGPIATYQKVAEARSTMGSIGRNAAHTRISLRKPDGTTCGLREPGEIWVKGPNNFAHYWNDPEATAQALHDGWFKTGDIAYRCEEGLLWFAGRSKHVIISGGENIYPAELERLLVGLPGMVEACVVGRPDPKWGEVPVVAAVVHAGGPDAQQILAAFTQDIARYKHPKDVVFLDALPKNALGKILIEEVKALILGK